MVTAQCNESEWASFCVVPLVAVSDACCVAQDGPSSSDARVAGTTGKNHSAPAYLFMLPNSKEDPGKSKKMY